MEHRSLSSTTKAAEGPSSHLALTDRVGQALIAMIMDREIEPGAPMRMQALTARLGVSATPTREALARLEQTGLVQRTAHRGYRVAPLPSVEQLTQLIEVRLVLETANAERTCLRADDSLLAALSETVSRQRRASTVPQFSNFKDFFDADWTFHRLIAENTGNPFLLQAFENSSGYFQRFMLFEDHVIDDARESTQEHDRILQEFQRRSPAGAAAAMQVHLTNLLERVGRTREP